MEKFVVLVLRKALMNGCVVVEILSNAFDLSNVDVIFCVNRQIRFSPGPLYVVRVVMIQLLADQIVKSICEASYMISIVRQVSRF